MLCVGLGVPRFVAWGMCAAVVAKKPKVEVIMGAQTATKARFTFALPFKAMFIGGTATSAACMFTNPIEVRGCRLVLWLLSLLYHHPHVSTMAA